MRKRALLLLLTFMALGMLLASGVALSKVVNGTKGADTLRGTKKADTMRGLGGHDTMYAFGGRDVMYGGSGNDELRGKEQADRLEGGDGDDRMWGGWGPDKNLGGRGNDGIFAASFGGPDMVRGGPGNDYMGGCAADGDVVFGETGRDDLTGGLKMHGGSGSDWFWVYTCGQPFAEPITAYGGTGEDRLSTVSWQGAIYHIYVTDGERDVVACGVLGVGGPNSPDVGHETVEADAIDEVDPTCDKINRH